jgi:hypothetical protein
MGVRRPYAWESQTTHLQKDERLTTLRPDWHVRRGRDGLHKAYLCTDKRGTHLICTQKLPLLAEHINRLVGDKTEQISPTALYNAVTNDGSGLNGGHCKLRWRVRAYPLEDAIAVFESARTSFDTVTVLGSKQSI